MLTLEKADLMFNTKFGQPHLYLFTFATNFSDPQAETPAEDSEARPLPDEPMNMLALTEALHVVERHLDHVMPTLLVSFVDMQNPENNVWRTRTTTVTLHGNELELTLSVWYMPGVDLNDLDNLIDIELRAAEGAIVGSFYRNAVTSANEFRVMVDDVTTMPHPFGEGGLLGLRVVFGDGSPLGLDLDSLLAQARPLRRRSWGLGRSRRPD